MTRYVHYGSGPKRFPIQDVLQCALEFAQHGSVSGEPTTEPQLADNSTVVAENTGTPLGLHFTPAAVSMDVDMESPRSLNRFEKIQ